MAVEQGVSEGYEGKGALYVWAAGNGHRNGDRATLDGRLNHYSVVPVCAVNYDDVRSEYSELGSNLWICGPSSDAGAALPGIVTTANLNAYTASFGGTSAATPIVSGVVALVRAVNPDLTWRDVKLILAGSARKNDPSDEDWEEGAIEYGPSTDRYWFNHQYGFGMVDAGAAAALAADWTGELPPLREISASSYEQVTVPDASENAAGSTVSASLTIDPYVDFIEFVSVEVTMTHTWFRDLHIEVESPSGAVSVLTVHAPAAGYLILLKPHLSGRLLQLRLLETPGRERCGRVEAAPPGRGHRGRGHAPLMEGHCLRTRLHAGLPRDHLDDARRDLH